MQLKSILEVIQPERLALDETITQSVTSRVSLVNDVGTHIIQAGGKRLRPLLVILCAKACGYGVTPEQTDHITLAAIIEFIHTATLLHDIGKAVTHKVEGKHHHIGAELARKAGMPDEIVHAIEAHHDDIEATTPEALVVRVCDAISAARPGARNISAENFAERMRDLENIATGFKGIDKAYAISAGREVRVIVKPENVDDLSAIKLARDIANKIESTMQYPGTIKVNVIRETRAVEFAK